MYEVLKSIAQKLFPGLLTSHEERIRKMVAWKYKGNKYQCNICETHLSSFVHRDNGDRLCPRCGSLGRTRRLYSLLSDEGAKKKVLHFSPPKSIKKRLEAFDTYQYHTTDYEGEFDADFRYDITQMGCKDERFDLIICYHVLEHIVKDVKAMTELYRVLRSGGQVYIQTPFAEGELQEDYSIQSPDERLLYYGQADHVRVYTADVLVDRLGSIGFDVEVLDYQEEVDNFFGYKVDEIVLLARKDSAR